MKPTMSNVNDPNVYLCNFRVSVDGDWLCLKELHDLKTCEFPPRAIFFPQDYGKFFIIFSLHFIFLKFSQDELRASSKEFE